MDERNQQHNKPQERHSYENGSTQPPKNHGSAIAVALCGVILVCGIISAYGAWKRDTISIYPADSVISFNQADSGHNRLPINTPGETIPLPNGSLTLELSPAPGSVDNIPQAGGLGLQEIYDKNIPSVVSITCTLSGGTTSGTGLVLSENGYLVTNAHVVSGAQQIEVLFTDGRTMNARLVGLDQLSDLAVLYVNATDLIPASFGDSTQVRVGDAVVAIGDPLGVAFRGTMTDGIVSAINRNVYTDGRNMTLIQTNAALNSGNSGGPLINCYGQVIGINTMKIGNYADISGVEGLGFAIPSATVKEVVDQLIHQGYVSGRPTLPVSGEWVSSFNQNFRRMPAGLYIIQADAASGLRPKDILLRIDGVRITQEEELVQALYAHEAGDQVEVVYYRNGQQYTTTITLTELGK